MNRPNSIRGKGLEEHVNAYCLKHTLPFRYKHLVEWITQGDEYGEPVTAEWLRRRFGVSRPTMEKWLAVYKEQQNG